MMMVDDDDGFYFLMILVMVMMMIMMLVMSKRKHVQGCPQHLHGYHIEFLHGCNEPSFLFVE